VGLLNVQQLLRSTDIPYISFEEIPDSITYDSNLLYAGSPLRLRAQVRQLYIIVLVAKTLIENLEFKIFARN